MGISLALLRRMARSSDETGSPTVVAVVNTNPDLVRMLQIELERVGFVVLIIHIEDIRIGMTSVEDVFNEHDPRVIVYDLVAPYQQNYRFLEHLRKATAFKGRQFVLTSPNVKQLATLVGLDETVYEIVGRPSDIKEVVRAVKEASRARATR